MSLELTALLDEWHSGRDANGDESARFASRWYTVAGLRAYVPHVEDLVPDQALTDAGVTHLRARFAPGADGALDVRVETEGQAGVVTERWRGGDLSRVIQGGAPGAAYVDHFARIEQLAAGTLKTDTLDEAAFAVSLLKQRRNQLRDQGEAGAVVDVTSTEAAIADTRVVLDVKIEERHATERQLTPTEDQEERF